MKPIFVNTRPASRIKALPKLAKLAKIVELPLLSFVERVLDSNERQYQARLINGGYDVLVVVSITAVEFALASLTQEELRHLIELNQSGKLAIVAVGEPTAKALGQVGLIAQMPLVASNESMSQMPIFEHAKRVLFWRGVGGRVFLMEHLTKQGVVVDKVDFYERHIPNTLSNQVQALDDDCPIIVLISSEMAWQAWQSAGGHKLICQYIVMGERLGVMIQGAKVVYALDDETLASAVARIIYDRQ